EVLRVQKQVPLKPQDQIEEEDEDEAEPEQVEEVLLPRLLLRRLFPDRAVEPALDAAEEVQPAAGQEGVTVCEDAGHVEPERIGSRDQNHDEDEDLRDALAHQKRSPRNSA